MSGSSGILFLPWTRRWVFRRLFGRWAGPTWLLTGAVSAILAASAANAEDAPGAGGGAPAVAPKLTELSLEDLARLQVTSVSKKVEPVSEAPAAIFVITQDDIRRSGAASIPEALRLVPGLQVARQDAHNWAVTSRGFADLFANKLLVLMDGRSVYTPLFSGVFWDVQDTMLEDIDRIEVIRGPGATLWGANAVNGVINIITRSAAETQGGLVSAGYGTEEQGFASARLGGKLGEHAHFRVYGKYFIRNDSVLPSGGDANDAWQMGRGGFRLDWQPSPQNLLTWQGDLYSGVEDQTYDFLTPTPPLTQMTPDKLRVRGGNVLGRWTHSFTDESDIKVQAYYDRTGREVGFFNEESDTFDLDLQHRFPLGHRQDVVWGAGYRYSDSRGLRSNFTASFIPPDRATHLFNIFAQDEITLAPERLRLTLGAKLEHNDYSGFEFQPSGRLLWMPHERHTFWGSAARAVRSPSRTDNDVRITSAVLPGAPPTAVVLVGTPGFRPEVLTAFELGYRVQPHTRVALDATTFYNLYDRLTSFEAGAPDLSHLPAYVEQPLFFANRVKGETYGAELAVTVQPAGWWRVRAAYTYLQIQLHTERGSTDPNGEVAEGNSPHHQVSVRSSMDLPGSVQFDLTSRYVDTLPRAGIPGYVTLDARLGWRPTPRLEFSIVGQNLLDDRHPEFPPSILRTERTEVERAVYGKITWRF